MGNPKTKQNWDSKRTFITLDIPSIIAEQITAIRRQSGSWRAALPVEITLAGSSGLGVLRYHESEIEQIFETLNKIGSNFAPIHTRFASMEMFSGTRIFYLAPSDPTPFIALQTTLVKHGLRFERSPFPFIPHCTITELETVDADLPAEFKSLISPETEIVLDSLSVYNLDSRILSGNPKGCRLLHRAKLSRDARKHL